MGATIASALRSTAGQAMRVRARRTSVMAWTSGWPWQSVPLRLMVKAMASRRSTSTPRLARFRTMPANSAMTWGLRQLRSHWKELKVVHTQPPTPSSQVKLPGAKSGKTSGRVRS